MRTPTGHGRGAALAAWCLAGVLGGSCAAQEAVRAAETPPADPVPLLAGPPVETQRPDRLEQGLSMMMAPMMAQLRQYPQDEVRRLLAMLGTEGIDPTLRLTPEQEEALREVGRDHNRRVREYRASHGDEFERLRLASGYLADPPLRPDQVMPEVAQARAAYREFVARGPTNADLQARLFAELTEAQQAWLNEKMAEILAERERAAYERRYAEALAADPVTLDDFLDAEGEVDLEALPDRLRARIERLEPERRRAALERLMARRADAERERPRRATADGDSPPSKPAPSLDEIEVPAPTPTPDG
ncbi:MAG: hypothetical protein ACTS22_07545 [Phycisphaerales bacterium]